MLNFSCLTARCVLLCKWASLREAELQAGGAAWEFINSCLGDECAPNRALLVTQQLVPCKMTFSFFSCSVLIIFLSKVFSQGWVLFSGCFSLAAHIAFSTWQCPQRIDVMNLCTRQSLNSALFVAGVPKGKCISEALWLLHEMVIVMHGRSAADLFLLVQMKITMMFQVGRKIISLISFQEEY